MKAEGEDLYVTFEGGMYVGVFVDEAAAERLNEVRRKAKGVEPVTLRYVPHSKLETCIQVTHRNDGVVLSFDGAQAFGGTISEALRRLASLQADECLWYRDGVRCSLPEGHEGSHDFRGGPER